MSWSLVVDGQEVAVVGSFRKDGRLTDCQRKCYLYRVEEKEGMSWTQEEMERTSVE